MAKIKKETKELISNFVKVFLLLFMMSMGFFICYALTWFAIGLPQTDWAISICFALGCASEYGYYLWARNCQLSSRRKENDDA